MSRILITASGKPIIVENDKLSDEDALAGAGEAPHYAPGPGPEGADYKGGLIDYMQSGAGGMIQSLGGMVPGSGGTALEDIGYGIQQRNPYAGNATGLIDAYSKGEFLPYAGYLAATQMPNLAMLAAAARFGLPGAIAYTSAIDTGDILQRQAQDTGKRDYASALGLGIPLGVMEATTGVGSRVARLAEGGMAGLGSRALPKFGLSVAAGAGEEALQNTVTEAGQRLATGEPMWSPEAQQAYLENAAQGALLGAPFGALEHFGGHGHPHPVDDAPGQPTDLMQPQLALPAPPLQLTGPGSDFTMRGGTYAPRDDWTGPPGGGGQLALPAPEQVPLLTASSPYARAEPGTQLGLPLEGGVSNQQMQLPMNMPERAPQGQMQLPMNLPEAEAPATPSTWAQPELPMGQQGAGGGPPVPPGGAAGPLFRAPERAAPEPAPPPQQLELPGVPLPVLHNPDVVRAMIGGSDHPQQSKGWLTDLSTQLSNMAQAGDMRGIASEIDRRRQEVEDASNRKKNPIAEKTTTWRNAALDRADNWLNHVQNAAPEAAPRAPVETRAPEQLPLPYGSTPQPEAQLGLPMLAPERPGMATTMPAMRGVGEAASAPRTRLPEVEAWRQPQLPFERGARPPTPRGEAGPLFEEPPPPPKPKGPPAERQLSLMTKAEMEAPGRAKRAAAREAGRVVRERIARERDERKAAKDAKAAEMRAAVNKKATAAAAEAKRVAEAAKPEPAPVPVAAAPEPAPVPPPTETSAPRPVVEAKAPARKVNALRKQVEAAKAEADARERSAPLRSAAMELRDEGVITDADVKSFAQAQRETTDHDALAKILTDHIDKWASETKVAPEAETKAAVETAKISPTTETVAPAAPVEEAAAPSGPVEKAIAEVAEKPKVERVPFAEVRRFINDVLTKDAARLTEGQIGMITLEAAKAEPNFDKLREYGAKKFTGPKAEAWARIVDGVEKLQQARTEKTTAPAPRKSAAGGPRMPVVEKGLNYLKELGATALQRGAVFLRGDNIDSATAYPDSGKRAKARQRVTRLRQDRNHFASTMDLVPAQAQRVNTGVEAYLAETPPGNSDAWTNHGWNLGHLYQYGWVMPRVDPDVVATPAPVDREAISAKLGTYFDMADRMQVASGINAATAGLAIPTTSGAREGAAWYYERALQNRYFADAKAQAAEASARAQAEREAADAAKAAGQLPKRGRGRPRKDGLGPGGLAMRIELNEKQAHDYTRRSFLKGISAAALMSVTKPVFAARAEPTATTKHPELVKLLEAGKPKDALHWIASNSASTHYRWIAKALLKGPGGFNSLTMRIDPFLAETENAAGMTTVKDGRTEVRLDTKHGVDEDTFLHEMIHVYVNERWGLLNNYLPNNKRLLGDTVDRGDSTVKEFQDIWQSIQKGMVKNLDLNTDEGLRNAGLGIGEFTGSIDEALAWSLIDPKLRSYLRSVDINGNPVGDGKSAWRNIVNWFLKALNLDPIADPKLETALDALMSASGNMFTAGATVKPDLSFYTALDKGIKEQNKGQTNELLEKLNPDSGPINMAGLGMFIGESGTRAQSVGYGSLAHAKALEATGVVPNFGSEIKRQTGWYKNHAGGPWTFEISDLTMIIKQPHRMKEGHSGTTTLGRLIDHPVLFAAYPELKDLRVVFNPSPDMGPSGTYMPMLDRAKPMSSPSYNAKNEIVISTAPDRAYEHRSTLLHEMQHGVQDLEGLINFIQPKFSQLVARDTQVIPRIHEMANMLAISTDRDTAQAGKRLAFGLKRIINVVREARELENAGQAKEAAAMMASVDDIVKNNEAVSAAVYDLDWSEMQARQTQQRMNMGATQRARVNPNTQLIPGAKVPASRLIRGAYSEQRNLGEPLSLRGNYPVPNSEADPETTQMSDTLGKIAGSKELTPEQRDLASRLAPLVEGTELRSGTGELPEGQRGQVTTRRGRHRQRAGRSPR